jgi:TPR repeat protein
MADLARDASGPASSEPAGIAVKQTGQPLSSEDRGKLRVFISYSRDDLKFADQLDAALSTYGFECLIDRYGISGGEDWKRRLGHLVSEADTVVFVLSPSSARSEICDWEVEEATRLNKRILPVNCRPLEGVSPPPRLRDLNYIFLYEEPKVLGSGFGTGLASLITALNTDFDWLRDHTRYLQRAIEWDTGGRPANRLLSGDDIAEAKAWVARRPKGAPEPTALHLDFIRASEEEAETRLSEQRKQLDAMAAAQAEREKALHEAEKALKQAADAQRRRATIRNIALLAVGGLAVVAVLFACDGNQQRITAEKQRHEADEILGRATTIILNLQEGMDSETKHEAFALFQAGAELGNASSIRNLGFAYRVGLGVPQDDVKAREWFEKAAAKDKQDSANAGEYYAKQREWYEKAAAHDWPPAMTMLGWLYLNGYGVARDHTKALEWFEKAAEKGEPAAMVDLGRLYAEGLGVAQDDVKAREWFEKAAAKDDANAKIALEKLSIREVATAGRYDEALRLAEAFAAKLEAEETKRDGKPGEQTAQALTGVTWLALFAKEFTKALTVADRAHALFPNNLSIETNRAHALMFMEHDEEAKALYLAHKGMVRSVSGKLWEQIIAEDFAKLRDAGLSHPMMADVEKEFSISR